MNSPKITVILKTIIYLEIIFVSNVERDSIDNKKSKDILNHANQRSHYTISNLLIRMSLLKINKWN